MSQVMEVIKKRRSHYVLGKDVSVSNADIQKLVEDAVQYVPSAFNSQSNRVVVLLGSHHDKFWDINTNILKGVVPAENFASTQEKMDLFKGAYGTVLFFEDKSVVEGLQKQFPLYADNFTLWAHQSVGMLEYTVWNLFEEVGLGASLQHYNPLVDEQVAAEWNIPSSWVLNAQMPFGKPQVPAGEKEFAPVDQKVKVFQ